jgi:hypothetical protein
MPAQKYTIPAAIPAAEKCGTLIPIAVKPPRINKNPVNPDALLLPKKERIKHTNMIPAATVPNIRELFAA